MGAAWREPKDRDLDAVCAMVTAVRQTGLETCATLGMLSNAQAVRLKQAGLDFYNHNLDTSPEFYGEIISTRTYSDRLETLENVRAAGIRLCCGGIIGMGETIADRAGADRDAGAPEPRIPNPCPSMRWSGSRARRWTIVRRWMGWILHAWSRWRESPCRNP